MLSSAVTFTALLIAPVLSGAKKQRMIVSFVTNYLQIRLCRLQEMKTMIGKNVQIGVSLLVGNMENMVQFYRDVLGFHTQWSGGPFADFETASGELSLFMYSREEFVKAIA